MFVDDGDGKQGSLFIETATLSQMFFDQLKKHPVPIDEVAVRQIANNSLALDVYCWLAYRLHVLTTPVSVSWKALLYSSAGHSVPPRPCSRFISAGYHLALATIRSTRPLEAEVGRGESRRFA